MASLPNQIHQDDPISKTELNDKEIKDESIPKEILDSLQPDIIKSHQVRDASAVKIEVEIKDDDIFNQYSSELPVKGGNQDRNTKDPTLVVSVYLVSKQYTQQTSNKDALYIRS